MFPLQGWRGLRRRARVRLSEMVWEHREHLGEMDINPIIANEDGLFPVDARMILR